ncbi:NADH dehydrogenase [ubiquinone] 1 alpha subcomplex subunit 2-like [Hylobates moloch]|uniref:NADH dehydrogenase [ubiquinone] 1 alpha subcomplex subunit 2-like n=1 Tax=Hylobates moloch TaxID=81572 RepID=UPI0026748914|nr:NADH dehydrogenase [ubiquinone] 1 alpha subcomplex subunit 2-like [Hylobates moloch]
MLKIGLLVIMEILKVYLQENTLKVVRGNVYPSFVLYVFKSNSTYFRGRKAAVAHINTGSKKQSGNLKPQSLALKAQGWRRPAASRGIGAKLGLREIRIRLRQRSPGSQGVRDFIEKRYVELKKANPDLSILIRECADVQPKLWARYAFGQEKNVPLNNFSADQVTRALENVLSGKA